MQRRSDGPVTVDYRAFFSRHGLTSTSLDAACAMARERLNRLLGQRVRRELERMRYRSRSVG